MCSTRYFWAFWPLGGDDGGDLLAVLLEFSFSVRVELRLGLFSSFCRSVSSFWYVYLVSTSRSFFFLSRSFCAWRTSTSPALTADSSLNPLR